EAAVRMKLSERFDRRYQQSPMTGTVPPLPASAPPVPVEAPAPVVAPRPAVQTEDVVTIPSELSEQAANLSPALAAAKAEIHAQLLSHHTAQIDINNRAGIRRLLLQLTDEHFRSKPPAALVTGADKERL